MFFVFVLAGVITAWASSATRTSQPITRVGDVSVHDLKVGDCFDPSASEPTPDPSGNTPVHVVTARPCAQPHDFEVFAVMRLPDEIGQGSGDPTHDDMDNAAADRCVPAFGPYVGLLYGTSSLEGGDMQPSVRGWQKGDRTLVCYVYDPAHPQSSGSLHMANR
jgi:hypothetical protein